MTFARARTSNEAYLYLELNPCEQCGSTDVTWRTTVVDVQGQPATRYSGPCRSCGARRVHYFSLPPYTLREDDVATFGGRDPSELLDPGEWVAVAERVTADAAPDDEGLSLEVAAAAVDEAVKFVPPGEAAVPDWMFWSTVGAQLRSADPSRFRLDRLLAMRDDYRERAARLIEVLGQDRPSLPRARTLEEASLYVDLLRSGQEVAVDPADASPTLVEGEDAWTVTFEANGASAWSRTVLVPYAAEMAARRAGSFYGLGASELIDAAQWLLVRDGFARHARHSELGLDGTPDGPERTDRAIAFWVRAIDAGRQVAELLSAGADEVPLSACWTALGRALWEENRELFARERLDRDRDAHLQELQDLAARHGGQQVPRARTGPTS